MSWWGRIKRDLSQRGIFTSGRFVFARVVYPRTTGISNGIISFSNRYLATFISVASLNSNYSFKQLLGNWETNNRHPLSSNRTNNELVWFFEKSPCIIIHLWINDRDNRATFLFSRVISNLPDALLSNSREKFDPIRSVRKEKELRSKEFYRLRRVNDFTFQRDIKDRVDRWPLKMWKSMMRILSKFPFFTFSNYVTRNGINNYRANSINLS